jgi:cytochrome c5
MNKAHPIALATTLLFCQGQPASASERLEDGKRTYEKMCATCHATGVDGAPIVGNKEDWQDRSHLWEAVLLEHAEKGYVKMPARGAAEHATDYDISVAAEYMLTLTHPELKAD